MDKMTGKVWVLGDDIDTDIIIPTEYLALKIWMSFFIMNIFWLRSLFVSR